ncbi:substrate-binding domain-containing protein [Rhodococcus chondri]|uniref:Substrate-binding domain-containing protein n=1 Tax=Rhodococcus chondri TaxID=3065941 RepID=A0ABU7JWQ1_9NOCA|nr:substrate-binding domain-containing protein [Rhodococcus sp. CC-R104]MEE2034456.1 substrate-binding domain-containing protein [Rhodococcus sp. CC-R104]
MTGGSGEAVRGHRRSGQGRYVIAGLVVALVAVGVAAFAATNSQECAETDEYTVAVAPGLEPALSEVLGRADTGCYRYTVTADEPGDVAARLGKGTEAPDLWIPEGGWWAPRAAATAKGPVRTISVPVATSPVVLVAAPGRGPLVPNWRSALALRGLDPGNPLRTGAAAAAIRAALAETADDPVAVGTVRTVMAPLAQKESARSGEPPTGPAMLDAIVSSASLGVATEQQAQSYIRTRERDLDVTVPDNGSLLLDYSVVATAPDPERHARATVAGTALADVLHTADAREVLSRHGFRDPAGQPLPDGRGVGPIPVLSLQDEQLAQEALAAWTMMALPVRTLFALDVSESMHARTDGKTRVDLIEQAAVAANGLFPDSVAAGLWAFSEDLGGPSRDHVEVVPIRRFDTVVDGRTQREILMSLSDATSELVGSGTALYDTTLAAFRKMQDTYDPRSINSVVLLTDGRDDDPNGISKEYLLDTLAAERDPARPVVIVPIGISDDADAETLAEIAAATGGTSYLASDPDDLVEVFVNALADRTRR